MALSIGVDQLAVHQCSKAVVQDQTSQYSWNRKSEWRPPAFTAATCPDEEPIIPSPTVFGGLDQESRRDYDEGKFLTHNEGLLPSVAECAVHLQLLDSILMLREKVIKSNALDCAFSIRPVERFETTGYGLRRRRVKKPDDTLKTRREKKWLIFVKLAVSRFFMWCGAMEDEVAREAGRDPHLFGDEYLPQLDILMVWHSLMLNPKLYESFCEAGKFKKLQEIDMPWAAVHKAISPRDSSYKYPESTASDFLKTDLLQYLTDFPKFSPSIIEILFKWANTDLTPADLEPLLSTPSPLPDDQSSLLHACNLAISPNETSPTLLLLPALSDAIHRQFTFITKIHQHAWLRSPALQGTLRRALDRYAKYLTLFRRFPGRLLVPTLDIDLVWHTHLCSPRRYDSAVASRAGRLINHDDTVGRETLEDGLEVTRGFYRVGFGEEYLRCLCWDCEALRDALEVFGEGEVEVDYGALAEKVGVDVAYHRAVEIARRKEDKLLPARLK